MGNGYLFLPAVDIWLEYINFCVGRMGTESGTERCRETFERALGTCGLHVSLGSIIWDMYRDFEAALLGTTTSEDDLQAQESRFMSLCRRQLSVPLLGMGTTYEYVKSKIEIDDNTVNAYKKALSRLKTLETWEAKLVSIFKVTHVCEASERIFVWSSEHSGDYRFNNLEKTKLPCSENTSKMKRNRKVILQEFSACMSVQLLNIHWTHLFGWNIWITLQNF